MPEYCPDSLAFSPRYAEGATAARQRRWVAMMGESFWDIHHYCWAIAVINRSKLTGVDKQRREYMLRDAIDDITYVLRRARPDFVLLPEIYTRLGDVQQSRERPVDALYAYEQAVQSRADYWPAYVRLADLHASLGSNEQAVTVVERGLTVLPEQPQLLQVRNRLAQKSGKKSKP